MFAMKKYAFFMLLVVIGYLTYDAVRVDWYSWDLSITKWIQGVDVGSIANYNNRMGIVGAAGVLGLIVIAWLWFKGWRAEAFFVGIVGITNFLNPLFRYVIGRPRPSCDIEGIVTCPEVPDGFSFPSGTAMHVVMFCGFIIYLSYRVLKSGYLRNALNIIMSLWIPVMGIWIIYLGRHWTSDVIGGYLYGAFFLWIIIWGYRRYVTWRRIHPKEGVPSEKLPTAVQPLAWVIKMVY